MSVFNLLHSPVEITGSYAFSVFLCSAANGRAVDATMLVER
jgi:hypothetical protein